MKHLLRIEYSEPELTAVSPHEATVYLATVTVHDEAPNNYRNLQWREQHPKKLEYELKVSNTRRHLQYQPFHNGWHHICKNKWKRESSFSNWRENPQTTQCGQWIQSSIKTYFIWHRKKEKYVKYPDPTTNPTLSYPHPTMKHF